MTDIFSGAALEIQSGIVKAVFSVLDYAINGIVFFLRWFLIASSTRKKRNEKEKWDTLQRHTAATGFAGICTDAALPLAQAASVLSRTF